MPARLRRAIAPLETMSWLQLSYDTFVGFVNGGEKLYFQGIGERITGYLHQMPVRVGDERFECKIAFSPEYEVSFNLLGRNNFFPPFLITFNEKLQKLLVEKNITGGH